MDDDYTNPTVEYHDDKRNPDNYVRIGVEIKGLRKKTFGKGAENADVKLECTERSMCLTVIPKGKSSISKYRYEVRQLPGDIMTDETKTYFKVQKDMVEVFLHKASPGLWARQLSSIGLEQDTC